MSAAGLFISLALGLIALAIVARPFFLAGRSRGAPAAEEAQRRRKMHSYYQRVLTNMRDLDEDFATGKIASGDYKEEREVWMRRGIELLRAQDRLDKAAMSPAAAASADELDRAIEAAVAAYRGGSQRGERRA